MDEKSEQHRSPRLDAFRQYFLGLGIGSLCALYGVYGLITRTAFLPVLKLKAGPLGSENINRDGKNVRKSHRQSDSIGKRHLKVDVFTYF